MYKGDIADNMPLPTLAFPFDQVFKPDWNKHPFWPLVRGKKEDEDCLHEGARVALEYLADKSNVELITFGVGEREAEKQWEMISKTDLPVRVLHRCFKMQELRPLLMEQQITYYYDSNHDRRRWAGLAGVPFSHWTTFLSLRF